ncbi:hypothetical protein LGL04_23775 [Clostridium tagluense]|uniref:hypothetical protein n=1 Tax=Clostridium tagluense TaxID=360422 RepID=UPI001CF382B1|nr:hypothetical protein [Clostridium tagluense]MCB2318956.1 hypothetical protein [Clostridium tagluense]
MIMKKIITSLAMCLALMAEMTVTAGAVSPSGTSTFTKAVDGTGYDVFNSVQQTSDGGYIAAGTAQSTDGDFAGVGNKGLDDATLVKFNSDGTTGWIKALGGTKGDLFNSVQQTSDGGYIVAGCSGSSDGDFAGVSNKGSLDATLVKFNKNGTTEWIKGIGGKEIDRFYSVQQTSDGGYIAAGYSDSSDGDFAGVVNKGLKDAILVKFDKNGTTEWVKDIGGRLDDYFRSVKQTSDGGYIVAGNSQSSNGDFTGVNKGSMDAILVKFNKSGTTEWIKNVGGSDGEVFYSVQQTSDGGYVAAGTSRSTDGDFANDCNKMGYVKMALVKFKSNGTTEWVKGFGGARYGEKFRSVQQTSDGGYVAVGDSTHGATLIKSE